MPDLISGVAPGVVPRGAGAMEQFDPLKFVTTLQNLKMQQQNQAMGQLQTMIQMGTAGMNVDPREMEKVAKKAGINPGTGMPQTGGTGTPNAPSGTPQNPNILGGSPQEIPQMDPNIMAAMPGLVAGGSLPTSASAPPAAPVNVPSQQLSQLAKTNAGPPQGAQAANPVSTQAANANPAGGKTQPGSPMASGGMFADWLAMAKKNAVAKAQGTQDQFAAEHAMNQLTMDALNPQSPTQQQSMGILRRHSGAPFSVQEEMWNAPGTAGEQYRSNMYKQAAGAEMPAEKREREARWAEAMYQKGAFNSIKDAYSYIQGDPGATQPKVDLTNVLKEADLMTSLVQAGVPGDQVRRVATSVISGGANLGDVLPPDIKPLVLQKMEEDKRHNVAMETEQAAQTGVQMQRLKLDEQNRIKELTGMAQRLQVELDKSENTELKNNMDFLINAKRQGLDVPPGLQEATMSTLAKKLGYRLEEKPHAWYELWDKLMGNKDYQMVPNISDASGKTIDAGAGGGQTAPPATTPSSQNSTPGTPGASDALTGALGQFGKFLAGPYQTGPLGSIIQGVAGSSVPQVVKNSIKSTWDVTDAAGKTHNFKTKAEADAFAKSQSGAGGSK